MKKWTATEANQLARACSTMPQIFQILEKIHQSALAGSYAIRLYNSPLEADTVKELIDLGYSLEFNNPIVEAKGIEYPYVTIRW